MKFLVLTLILSLLASCSTGGRKCLTDDEIKCLERRNISDRI